MTAFKIASLYFFMIVALTYADERRAVVVLMDPNATVTGAITFHQTCDICSVIIEGTIEGLKPGLHGFHVHDKGDLTAGCTSALAHFNLKALDHGGPTAQVRHSGDLGNIEANSNGVAIFSVSDSTISLVGDTSVIGRAVVLHADEDDLGLGGFPDSLTTGHAGARIACGVVGIQ